MCLAQGPQCSDAGEARTRGPLVLSQARSQNAKLFVFVALRPMSTAMVIAGRSVHLSTLFPGQA